MKYQLAAEVYESLDASHIDMRSLLDKAEHLSLIHSLPKECWLLPIIRESYHRLKSESMRCTV